MNTYDINLFLENGTSSKRPSSPHLSQNGPLVLTRIIAATTVTVQLNQFNIAQPQQKNSMSDILFNNTKIATITVSE